MFDEGQLYSPVTRAKDGGVQVQLGEDHPGVKDPEYRARRNSIAQAAADWMLGDPLPDVEYTVEEQAVWRDVCRELASLHAELACAEFLIGQERVQLPVDRIPQLTEVSARVTAATGFEYRPAAGLVPLREFYGSLADGAFYSTQYIRHHSVPLYTPEPDVIHEVVGHGNCLGSDRFSALYRTAGRAARRVETETALEFVSKVFWFSLEFGVVREDDRIKAYGAGLLSSYGEIQQMAQAKVTNLNISRMGTQTYNINEYQPLLFCAASFDEVEDVVGTFFETASDDSIAGLTAAA